MPARFTESVELTAATPLTDLHRARLAVVGPLYFGGKGPANLAGADLEGDPMETRTLMFCEERKVVDGDRHLYDAWFYMGDSGTFFTPGTTKHVAEIIQCGLQCGEPNVRAILAAAMAERDSARAAARGTKARVKKSATTRAHEQKPPAKKTGMTKPPKRAPAKTRANNKDSKTAKKEKLAAKRGTKGTTAKKKPSRK
jgi:hypothetical protein